MVISQQSNIWDKGLKPKLLFQNSILHPSPMSKSSGKWHASVFSSTASTGRNYVPVTAFTDVHQSSNKSTKEAWSKLFLWYYLQKAAQWTAYVGGWLSSIGKLASHTNQPHVALEDERPVGCWALWKFQKIVHLENFMLSFSLFPQKSSGHCHMIALQNMKLSKASSWEVSGNISFHSKGKTTPMLFS